MKYINKKLSIEKVAVENIAKRYKTPTYCYSYKQLKENIKNLKLWFYFTDIIEIASLPKTVFPYVH